jgi:hypothetical protein
MNEQPMSLRDTAQGIAVRAGILGVGGVVVSGLVVSTMMKTAGTLVRTLTGLFLMLITGGLVTWEARKVQRRLAESL